MEEADPFACHVVPLKGGLNILISARITCAGATQTKHVWYRREETKRGDCMRLATVEGRAVEHIIERSLEKSRKAVRWN
jgi:hypothetical protein